MRRNRIVGTASKIRQTVGFCKRTGILASSKWKFVIKAQSSVTLERNSRYCQQVWTGVWEEKARARCMTIRKNEIKDPTDWKGKAFGEQSKWIGICVLEVFELRGMYNQFAEVKWRAMFGIKRTALKDKTSRRRWQKDGNPWIVDSENEPNQWEQSSKDLTLAEHWKGRRFFLW
jgi:hypothetical protein